ncbi:sugar isomerase domain-containing protein [Moorella naiadis]|uniref:sugar isomerase domain-containing protein n=1 Tax=Moorella naiadis (nom. illeg.) TaxID=3093670 RepID=UPI003D9CB733
MLANSATAGDYFLAAMQQLTRQIRETQATGLNEAAAICADAIAGDRVVFMFGAGHSAIPVMETFPRIGSIVGFYPMLELYLSYNARVVGDMGMRQASYLEKLEGYAGIIMQNYEMKPPDAMILISHSGINQLIVDMALEGRRRGLKIIAITSRRHSLAHAPRHSSGLRLSEAADVVLDTCVPEGDALVELPGLRWKVASASTIASCLIADALVARTAEVLLQRGYEPLVYPSHNVNGSPAEMEVTVAQEEKVLREFRRRARMV